MSLCVCYAWCYVVSWVKLMKCDACIFLTVMPTSTSFKIGFSQHTGLTLESILITWHLYCRYRLLFTCFCPDIYSNSLHLNIIYNFCLFLYSIELILLLLLLLFAIFVVVVIFPVACSRLKSIQYFDYVIRLPTRIE